MNINPYIFFDFIHVALFAYWLGPDWGVFINGRQVANEALSKEERLRFLKTSVLIDVLPRSSIVLLLAVGLTLASIGGYIKFGGVLFTTTVWAVAIIWLSLVWLTGYILGPGPLNTKLSTLHVALRHILTVFFITTGVYSLLFDALIATKWLAVKFILVGGLLAIGSILRHIVIGWRNDLTNVKGYEGAIARTYPMTRKLVVFFWLVSLTIAFLGVVKPF